MKNLNFLNSKESSISFIVTFFKIFGLAPFEVVFSKSVPQIFLRSSTQNRIYTFLLSIPCVALLVRIVMNFSTITPKLVLRKLVTINLSWISTVILWYYCFNHQKIIRILNDLLDLEQDLVNQFNRSVSRRESRNYEIASFISEVVLMILQVIPFIFEAVASDDWWAVVMVTSGFIINIFMLQHTILVHFINKRLNFTNELLLSLIKNDNCSDLIFVKSATHNELILRTIILLKQHQRKLLVIFKDLSDFFEWPILLTIIIFCIRLILYSYKFAKRVIFFSHKIPLISFICEPATMVKEIFIIVIFTNQMTQITSETKKTGEVIFEVMDAYSTHGGIQSQLKQFSIEVLHRKIPDSIFGLFKINGGLVTAITASVITYLVILIQFNYNLDIVDA
ncbi:GSCOCT00013807001.3-RA-CDS [Cotesia congregata]|uniref:Gustatory receptor n=1 Tax=Cotesia congregata TaxID=51543 RepID=A0A8J2H8Q1_COTCN|nr:GSCOCT00013807001.3-RA-CDS [Cotesia congregata]CAG5085329.1 gustatory receptor 51 [Cotesia congregata]